MPRKSEPSFEALALPHLDAVYRVARRLSHNDHEAEDLVQETYLKALKAFGAYEVREFGIKPWLFKILNNTFINRKVREKRAPRSVDQVSLDQTQPANERASASDAPPELDYEQLDGEVKQAIDDLQPEFRSVLLLWATMEMSYQDIAEVLGVPIGTVMSRLHRGRQQLAKALATYAQENRLPLTKGSE